MAIKIITSFLFLVVLILFSGSSSVTLNNASNNSYSNPFIKNSFAEQDKNILLGGINMRGYYTNMAEQRPFKLQLPENYYEDSFRAFSQAGINFVRYLFFWESYEKDPFSFINELATVADTADRWKIKVIYTNDQYHTSSWLEPTSATGFPSLLFKNNPSYVYGTGGGLGPKDTVAKKWWTDWLNRAVKGPNGVDGWTLQADFLKKIVNVADKHNSTLGYEIINEPHISAVDQWQKVGNYNTFITDQLRKVTQKTIVYDRQVPSDLYGPLEINPENMAKMAPANKTNVMFKATLYGIPVRNSFAEDRLNAYVKAAQIAGVPLCMCEFNLKSYQQHPTPEKNINQTLVNVFIDKFKEANVWGWAYWLWNFRSHANSNFNLISITPDGKIQPTLNFDYIKNAIVKIRQSQQQQQRPLVSSNESLGNIKDTIFPTVNITSVNVTQPISRNVIVRGEAYDIGSGINRVNVQIDNGRQVSATKTNQGDWLYWTALVPVKSSQQGMHKIIARAMDNVGNIKKESVTFNIG